VKRLAQEDRAGIYITIIVHLVVLIVLLLSGISWELSGEQSFILDFTKAEEKEKLEKQESLKEAIAEKIDKIMAESAPVRNVTVDRSGPLKDDRNTDAAQLYKDAERLQKELNKGQTSDPDEYSIPSEVVEKKEDPAQEQHYSGPSVLSWSLEGRKASRLPIPAYRCLGAGEVKVLIGVDNSGTVVAASISESESSADRCLREFAIRAARISKFSSSPSAPPKQQGWIIYQFIAQ